MAKQKKEKKHVRRDYIKRKKSTLLPILILLAVLVVAIGIGVTLALYIS